MSAVRSATRYRVAWRLVQLRTLPPGIHDGTRNRQFYAGALLPPWVSDDELAHLLSIGAVEAER